MRRFLLSLALVFFTVIAAEGQALVVPVSINWGSIPVGIDTIAATYYYNFPITNNMTFDITLISISAWSNSSNNDFEFYDHGKSTPITRLSPQQTYYPTLMYNSQDTGIITGEVQILYSPYNSDTIDTLSIPMTAYAYADTALFLTSFVGGTEFLCQTSNVNATDWLGGPIDLLNPFNYDLYVDSIQASGDTSDFELAQISLNDNYEFLQLPIVIQPGSVPYFSYNFYPQDTGLRQMTVKVFVHSLQNGEDTLETTLKGYGAYQQKLTIEKSLLAFNPIYIGKCESIIIQMQNCGDSALISSFIIGPDSSNLSIVGTPAPFILLPGANSNFGVKLCPTNLGSSSDSIIFVAHYVNGAMDTVILPVYITAYPSTVLETPLEDISIIDNYPNPFRTSTTMELGALAQQAERISVVDMLGREITVLKQGNDPISPNGVIEWTPDAGIPTGTYFLHVVTRAGIVAKPMVYMR